jgi:hypothetical protein
MALFTDTDFKERLARELINSVRDPAIKSCDGEWENPNHGIRGEFADVISSIDRDTWDVVVPFIVDKVMFYIFDCADNGILNLQIELGDKPRISGDFCGGDFAMIYCDSVEGYLTDMSECRYIDYETSKIVSPS